MRRPSRTSFVFAGLVAVLLQVLAPGWAAVAMARQASALDDVAICTAHAADDGTSAPRHDSGKIQHLACPICQLAAAGHHVLPSRQDVMLPRPGSASLRHPLLQSAAPRGPPAVATRARGPPTLS
jgi:hypothetical protein